MKNVTKLFALALAIVAISGASWALAGGDECAKAAKEGCSASKDSCTSTCELGKCAPKMVMQVGDKSFECPISAEEAAKKDGKGVVFMVGHTKYENKDKAMAAYADVLDQYVANFATVRTQEECMKACASSCGSSEGQAKTASCSAGKSGATCSAGSKAVAASGGTCSASKGDTATAKKTGTTGGESCHGEKSGGTVVAKTDGKTVMYCVAGQCVDSKEKAEQISKVVMAAMKDVSMKYRVGDEEFCCDKMAGEKAKSNGGKIVYVVDGKTIECDIMARIQLDRAKIMAASKALEKANGKV